MRIAPRSVTCKVLPLYIRWVAAEDRLRDPLVQVVGLAHDALVAALKVVAVAVAVATCHHHGILSFAVFAQYANEQKPNPLRENTSCRKATLLYHPKRLQHWLV